VIDLVAQRPQTKPCEPPAPRPRPSVSGATILLLALCCATLAVQALPVLAAGRGVVVMAFWLLVPGGTLRALVYPRRALRVSPVDPALGVAVLCLLSQATLALGLVPATVATVVVALISGGAITALEFLRGSAVPTGEPQSSPRPRSWRLGRTELLILALTACALMLWLASWRRVSPAQIGSWGLLTAVPLTWYAAFAILLGCAVFLALTGKAGMARSLLWAAAVALLVLMIHATPAILEGGPRYTWTFKHFGVVRYLTQFHRAPRSADIYFNWPGFFSASAWIQQTTGWSLATLARWAPPFFELLSALGVLHLSRTVFRDARVIRLSVVLYVVANWVGQDYFSPQAMAFFLGLFLLASFMRLSMGTPFSPDRRVTAVTVVLTWLAVLTSHQLTPVMFLVSAVLVCVVLRRWPWRYLSLFVVTEAIWVALAVPYLRRADYPLLQFDPFAGSQRPVAAAAVHSVGFVVRADAVRALYYGLFLCCAAVLARAAYQAVKYRRDPRPTPVFLAAVLACGPTFVLLAQDYGGEGQLRAYLFAVPFLASVGAASLVSIRGRLRPIAAGLGVALVSGAFLLAYYGQEQMNVVGSADVAAVQWFYGHAPAGAAPMFIAPNSPTRVSPRYVNLPIAADALPTLLDSPTFARTLSANAAANFMESIGRGNYLIVTPSQGRYLAYFGIMEPEKYEALLGSLNADHRLHLVFSSGGACIWKLT
jgi:hypothetical protein